jgi:hypothetical protein
LLHAVCAVSLVLASERATQRDRQGTGGSVVEQV